MLTGTLITLGIIFIVTIAIFGETAAKLLLSLICSFFLSLISYFALGYAGMVKPELAPFLGIWAIIFVPMVLFMFKE